MLSHSASLGMQTWIYDSFLFCVVLTLALTYAICTALNVMTCRGTLTTSSPVGIKFAFSLRKEFSMTKVRPFRITINCPVNWFFSLIFIFFKSFVLQENSSYQRIDRWIKSGTVRCPAVVLCVSQTELDPPLFHSPPHSSSCLRARVPKGYTFTQRSGEFAITHWPESQNNQCWRHQPWSGPDRE